MPNLTDEQRGVLRDLIKKHQLESVGEMLESVAQNAIQIVTSTRDDYSSLGTSRIGGVPDLPPNVNWPDIEGKYLVFVAQINLAELPPIEDSPLPRQGILYFFHGYAQPASDIRNRVLYFDGPSGVLRTAELPDIHDFDEEEDLVAYKPYRILMKPFTSIPQYFSALYRTMHTVFYDHAASDEADFDENYFALEDELNASKGFDPNHLSQMLGFPIMKSSLEPEYKAQKAREGKYLMSPEEPDGEEVKKWLLLFELGSHTDAGMCWWDAGYFQYLIHQDDLDRLDFSRCYANIQTS